MYAMHLKRVLDVLVSLIALIIGSPGLALIALLIKIDSPGPTLYRQRRVGRDSAPFDIIKFRTMIPLEHCRLPNGLVLENTKRITLTGGLLRWASLDELPQLVNVLKGDMSIVGPRPTLAYQVERYSKEQLGRLTVRPGLTGLAQVTGRNTLTWEEKIKLDLEYVHNVSLRFDLAIMVRTIGVVLGGNKTASLLEDGLSSHHGEYWKDI